jgi:hypothetical protein
MLVDAVCSGVRVTWEVDAQLAAAIRQGDTLEQSRSGAGLALLRPTDGGFMVVALGARREGGGDAYHWAETLDPTDPFDAIQQA